MSNDRGMKNGNVKNWNKSETVIISYKFREITFDSLSFCFV